MMDMPLPEPDCLGVHFDGHSSDQIRARDAKWRDIVAAAAAKERERAFQWCDFYAHSIDHGGNKYVRSNDALTAAHAVKSGIPFPAKDAAAIRATSAKS